MAIGIVQPTPPALPPLPPRVIQNRTTNWQLAHRKQQKYVYAPCTQAKIVVGGCGTATATSTATSAEKKAETETEAEAEAEAVAEAVAEAEAFLECAFSSKCYFCTRSSISSSSSSTQRDCGGGNRG